jgi:hypothetical protein
MRILAHIHTLYDEAVIKQVLESIRRQARPLDVILLSITGRSVQRRDQSLLYARFFRQDELPLALTIGSLLAGLLNGI